MADTGFLFRIGALFFSFSPGKNLSVTFFSGAFCGDTKDPLLTSVFLAQSGRGLNSSSIKAGVDGT